MKLRFVKALGLSLAGILASGSAVHGSTTTSELLEVLVQKGVLTQSEANELLKKEVPGVKAANRSVDWLTISGRLHLQYDYLDTQDKTPGVASPSARSNFELRRIRIGFKADLVDGWSAFINTQFSNNAASLSDAIVSKKFDDLGTFTAGYQKVTFGYEENTSSANIKAIERSVATNYWAGGWQNQGNVGLGDRHIGIFWKGNIGAAKGLSYGVEITNSQQGGATSNLRENTVPGFYGNLSYSGSSGDLKYKAGINLAYQNQLNNTVTPGLLDQRAFGWNPYVELNYAGFRLMTEVLGSNIQNGRVTGGVQSNANPIGINVIPSYKFTDQLEAVFRYSYLDTNGRGAFTALERRSPTPAGNPAFDKVNTFYVGGNWYIVGNTVKLSAGYEYAAFTQRIGGGSDADVHAIRSRLQLLF